MDKMREEGRAKEEKTLTEMINELMIKQRELEIREEGKEIGRKEAREEAREKGIKCIVEALKEMGKDDFVIINKISEKYEISLKDAEEKVKKYS